MLSTLPLFWVAGLVIRALPTWATGCSLLFVDAFTPEGIIETLTTRRPTALHLRPPQVAELLRHPEFRPEMLATVKRGNGRTEWFAGHLPPDARFITGYGMTEMAGYVTALDSQDSEEARRLQMGAPLPGVEIRIVGANERICAAGETGTIRVRGPGMFSGYHKEATNLGLDADGWFITGDLGSIDDKGVFHFAGRTKDLLRVKGINVSPVEVERVLAEHPDVEAAYVVGLPPEGMEQRVVAVIVARSDNPMETEWELSELARRQLSHYKRPEDYVFLRRDEVPFGATSKPQRAELAAIALKRLG
jgi:fatty-acyl-CoA synthase